MPPIPSGWAEQRNPCPDPFALERIALKRSSSSARRIARRSLRSRARLGPAWLMMAGGIPIDGTQRLPGPDRHSEWQPKQEKGAREPHEPTVAAIAEIGENPKA